MTEPLLTVSDLSVDFVTKGGTSHAVKNVSFSINKGETLALIGESGSGKSVSAMSILQLLPYPAARHPNGSIKFKGLEMLHAEDSALQNIRGKEIGVIFQEPMTSLNPLHTIEKQIAESLMLHQGLNKTQARERVCELLDLVQLSMMKGRLDAYPHQLSGGQRQRIMIAMALANNPDLLIADEPTTALDVTVQAEILKLLENLQKDLGMAILFISHDLNLVKHMADKVCVMQHGEIVEQEKTATLFKAPKHDYTKKLLSAEPSGTVKALPKNAQKILEAQNITVTFPIEKTFFGKTKTALKAVDDISLTLKKGETIGIVGESGSGKTTLGLALMKLQKADGSISFNKEDITNLPKTSLKRLRSEMQIVFQDPFGSLSPRMSVQEILAEGLQVHHKKMTKEEKTARVINALEQVELDPAMRHRYPHEFSGGQRQRIAIARALILKPKLIVLDEPTSALDMSVQVGVLDLLKQLQQKEKLTYLFISHDLRVVRAMSHHIIVMKNGQVIEHGSANDVFEKPKETYTQNLLKAAFLK